ncbi:major facilitator superfamily transporter [Colletotrichum gloeosporioides Cg-14]|uniref:Major facilitator superfamily transporter n=1 Tax=Colletotrichum gloeosporioides (strain Cg-14) TaxID=1237896 RepID=T0LLZ0_COLGC|nr:major facilitator superfamily transporter [Colletotrichum gloeosporioides Cg-14]
MYSPTRRTNITNITRITRITYFAKSASKCERKFASPPPLYRDITAHGLGLYRGLAPEALAHPSEYPDLFEAARKIVITQRSRHAIDMTPAANRQNDRLLTVMQTNAVEDDLPWASRGYLYQEQNLLEKRPVSALGFAQEFSLLGVTGLHQILMFAGLSQGIAPALEIANSLTNLSEGQHSWFTAGFVLALGVFAMPSVRPGEVFGHKRILICGCLWYAFWSLLAGFSQTVHNGGYNSAAFFCVCRAMQGIGPAQSVPNGFSILEASFPPGQRKDTALSLYISGAPLGFVIGSVFCFRRQLRLGMVDFCARGRLLFSCGAQRSHSSTTRSSQKVLCQ